MSSVKTLGGKSSIRKTTLRTITGVSNVISNFQVQTRKRDFLAHQGASFSVNIKVFGYDGLPFDLTGWSFSGWFSKSFFGTASPIHPISISVFNGPTSGQLNLYISNADTLILPPGNYVYNVDIFQNSSTQFRVLEGIIVVEPGLS